MCESLLHRSGLRGFLLPFRTFLTYRSHLYTFLRSRVAEVLIRIGVRSAPPPPDFCAKEFSGNVQKGWELDRRLLLELRDFIRQRNMRLIVVVLPEAYQVYESAWNQYLSAFKIDPSSYDLDKPQKLLKDFYTAHQIECVDALPTMRSLRKEKQLCYPLDSHMTPEGHRVVADLLCKYLSAKWSTASRIGEP